MRVNSEEHLILRLHLCVTWKLVILFATQES
jgi:hypothetical protein